MTWISTKDKLPGDGALILAHGSGQGGIRTYIARRVHNKFIIEDQWELVTYLEMVTHWMPLPFPLAKQKEERMSKEIRNEIHAMLERLTVDAKKWVTPELCDVFNKHADELAGIIADSPGRDVWACPKCHQPYGTVEGLENHKCPEKQTDENPELLDSSLDNSAEKKEVKK